MQTQTQGYQITGPEEVCEKKKVFKEDVKEPGVQYCVESQSSGPHCTNDGSSMMDRNRKLVPGSWEPGGKKC